MENMITLSKAQYLVGDEIAAFVTGSILPAGPIFVHVSQLHLAVDCHVHVDITKRSAQVHRVNLRIDPLPVGNYGLEVTIGDLAFSTAFDVVAQSGDAVRYGFLSDFSTRDGDTADIDHLKRLHLNAIQFYDWMYKHDDLVSTTTDYLDPLGRPTNLDVIRMKIDACKMAGIRPFAYGAIYAANKSCFAAHPEWGLYTVDGQPLVFFDWLNFMNISPDSGWSDHIIQEFAKAMKVLGFQGIHLDTYGFPKTVCNASGHRFSLADVFPGFIDRVNREAKSIGACNGVIFNCVNNWPIESVAPSTQDALYIEVWPPHVTYQDLHRLIREAKQLSHRQVILAAYMHPFQLAKTEQEVTAAENALLLANAVINAAGGTQLVFGEDFGILCDSYYAKYAPARAAFQAKIRDYADFLVRYADLLYQDAGTDISMTAASGINEDVCFASEAAHFSSRCEKHQVWTLLRESKDRISVQLINLLANDDRWNEPKQESIVIEDIGMTVKTNRVVTGIYYASPDFQMHATRLDFQFKTTNRGREYQVKIPKLVNWDTVWIEME